MTSSPICILSDAHHMPNETNTWQYFITLLNNLPNNTTLITLGDFFDFWYRPVKDHQKNYGALLGAIKNATTKGIIIHFIVGNRDFFFTQEDADNLGITLQEEPFRYHYDGEKLCFLHGDLLLTQDHAYQKFRKFIRQNWIATLSRNLPYALADFIVKRIRKKTQQNKTTKPIDQFTVNLQEASHYLQNDDFLICGHTHIPLEEKLPTGKLRVLPAYGEKGEYLYKEPGKDWELKNGDV